jgi:hypothetical protein
MALPPPGLKSPAMQREPTSAKGLVEYGDDEGSD